MTTKMKKWIGLAALMVIMVTVCTACSGNGLEGKTWKYTYDAGSYTTFSFAKGECVMNEVDLITGRQESKTVPYSISGNKLTMDGETFQWKIAGNTLSLTQNGQTVTLEGK